MLSDPLRYVSLMCSVKTELQYYQQQEVIVLFSEAAHRGLRKEYITQDMMEMMDPSVMFAVPRLAIIRYIHVLYTYCIFTAYPLLCICICVYVIKSFLALLFGQHTFPCLYTAT